MQRNAACCFKPGPRENALEAFGRLDILVNNAGRAHAGGLLTSTDADWEEMAEEEIEVIVSAINVVDHVCADNLTEVEANDPTCTEDGYTTYVCSHDSSHTYTEVHNKLGHDYGKGQIWIGWYR